jgi:FSR family fosmidomycin resistance protein-like MFS transporter
MSSETAVLPSSPAGDLLSQSSVSITREQTVYAVLFSLSISHMLNDVMQSLLPAVYPSLAEKYSLNFTQVGFITFAFQVTASLLQPLVGMATDRKPLPYSLTIGMGFTFIGLISLSQANSFPWILASAALVGVGSSVFHPEASRVARMASGGQYGFAQSLFQVGGNGGNALGPLLAAYVVTPYGQGSIAWFGLIPVTAMAVLFFVGRWYAGRLAMKASQPKKAVAAVATGLSPKRVAASIGILLLLVFSKYIYLVSLTTYYQFYLMKRFGVQEFTAQMYLFVFLAAVAVGTICGGPVGDRIGFKRVIWGSILGVLPFSTLLPHVNLFWTVVLTVPIGLILASAFSAIIVYAQELLPSRVGMIAGLFFGFAFGIAGVGAAVLGFVADRTSLQFVYNVCAYLPAIGLLTAFLPNLKRAAA